MRNVEVLGWVIDQVHIAEYYPSYSASVGLERMSTLTMCTESNEIMNLRSFKQKPHLSSLSPSQNVRAKFSKKFTSHFPKFDNV